jgi:cytochrome c-type biogenesis protein CcmH
MALPAERWRLGALAAAVLLGAVALYALLGDPGAADPQRAELSAQLREGGGQLDDKTTQHVLAELQQHLQRQPDDARAWVMKARIEMKAQRYEAAAVAYERALQGRAKTVGDAAVWVEYAEARGLLQGGTLAGKPLELVEKALSIDPDQPQALDLAGSAAWEAGDYALAVKHWQRLLSQIPAGSPRHLQLSTAIQRAEQRARFALPPPPR